MTTQTITNSPYDLATARQARNLLSQARLHFGSEPVINALRNGTYDARYTAYTEAANYGYGGYTEGELEDGYYVHQDAHRFAEDWSAVETDTTYAESKEQT